MPNEDQIPASVTAALAAANANDTDAFLDCFAADGVAADCGREEIRGWSDKEFIGVRVSLEVTEVARQGDDTVITAQVGGDGFNGPSHFTFRVAGEKIARMTIRE